MTGSQSRLSPILICAGERNLVLCIYGKRSVYRTNSGKCVESGKRTAVPKVTGKREMKFYYIESLNDLETGAFGILEPKEEKKGQTAAWKNRIS